MLSCSNEIYHVTHVRGIKSKLQVLACELALPGLPHTSGVRYVTVHLDDWVRVWCPLHVCVSQRASSANSC